MESSRIKKFAVSFFLGLWIYSFVLWLYIVAALFRFPPSQFEPLSMYVPIRSDLLAVIAFPISFVSFVLWDYLRRH